MITLDWGICSCSGYKRFVGLEQKPGARKWEESQEKGLRQERREGFLEPNGESCAETAAWRGVGTVAQGPSWQYLSWGKQENKHPDLILLPPADVPLGLFMV